MATRKRSNWRSEEIFLVSTQSLRGRQHLCRDHVRYFPLFKAILRPRPRSSNPPSTLVEVEVACSLFSVGLLERGLSGFTGVGELAHMGS